MFDPLAGPLDGRNLVEASAGTGKTYTIAALFTRLVAEAGLGVDEILVVTFTEAATAELRARVRARLHEAADVLDGGPAGGDPFLAGLRERLGPGARDAAVRLRAGVRCFDQAAIATIHGFCLRALRESAFESGAPFAAEVVADRVALVEEVVADYWRRFAYGASETFVRYLFERGVGPASLTRFALDHCRVPLPEVRPDVPPPDVAAAENRVREAFDDLRRRWKAGGGEAADLVLEHPGLNRNRYRPGRVSAVLGEMDRFVAGGDPLAPVDGLDLLTPERLADGTKKGMTPPSHPVFDACGRLRDAVADLRERYDAAVVAVEAELLAHVAREVPARRAARDERSFDELLTDLWAALDGPGGARLAAALRARYRAALVDEFQDTDPVQYRIFQKVFAEADEPRLFLVGDPKQAIYGFRGADLFAYLGAARAVDRRFTLDRNWRSSQALLDGVEAVFAAGPAPFVIDDIGFVRVSAGRPAGKTPLTVAGEPDPAPLKVWWVPSPDGRPVSKAAAEKLLTAAVGQEVVSLLLAGRDGEVLVDGRPLGPGDVAVLVRTNHQARQVAAALNGRGVPAVIHSAESLFDAREAREMHRILAAVAEPADEGRVRAALATEILGFTGRRLHDAAADEREWGEWLDRFDRYRRLWSDRGFAAAAHALLADNGVRARLMAHRDGERRVTNVLHCVEVLQRAAVEHKLGPEGLVAWLGRQISDRPEDDEYQLRLETDDLAVQVLTVHRSKGLEYPVVLCPFAWEGLRDRKKDEREPARFHHPADPGRVVLDLGSGRFWEAVSLARREDLAERIRLSYVALTRARQRCYVAWGRVKGADTSPLAYLLHAPDVARRAPPTEVVDAVADAVGERDGSEWAADLDRLVGRSDGRVAVAPPPEPDGRVWTRSSGAGADLVAPEPAPAVAREWGVTSFSGFVSASHDRADRPDRDEGTGGEPDGDAPVERTIFSFPRGTRAGQCLHGVFEDLAFDDPDPARPAAVAGARLAAHGIGREWAEVVAGMVERVLDAPVLGRDVPFRLRGLAAADRLTELEFHLPVGRVSPAGLGRVLSRHPDADGPPGLAHRAARLGFPVVRGLLKGFVDLVFRHGGRYYLLDWKSNHLGNRVEAYDRGAMAAEMARHHYDLQYLLYAAALHRYLGRRLPGYRYDDHFGGAVYVFLRGVAPGSENGLYRARPSEAVVDGLARYLARGDDDG